VLEGARATKEPKFGSVAEGGGITRRDDAEGSGGLLPHLDRLDGPDAGTAVHGSGTAEVGHPDLPRGPNCRFRVAGHNLPMDRVFVLDLFPGPPDGEEG
jgi:hypothetical protein